MRKKETWSDQRTPFSDLTTYAKKRKSGERRQRPTSPFTGFLFTGRRRAVQRVEEQGNGYFVDRFGPADWIPPVALIVVTVADLILTSAWLPASGIWFTLVKLSVSLFAAAFFLLHSRFRRARLAIGILIFLYSCLLAYHGYNLGLADIDPVVAVAALKP